MRTLLGVVLLAVASSASAANPPSILNNSGHIAGVAHAALTVLGIPHQTDVGPSGSTLVVNQTCPNVGGAECSTFLFAGQVISDAMNTSKTEYGAASATVVTPLVPYQLINQSSKGYTVEGFEQPFYTSLLAGGLVYSMAYCGTPAIVDYPPTTFVTVLPNNSIAATVVRQKSTDPHPPETDSCGYAQGIEFSLPMDSAGCLPACTWTPVGGAGSVNVNSPSAATEVMTAVLAALKFNHPLWNWADVKSVLRVTASNWASGYTAFNPSGPGYGYGNINYAAANAYSGTIYLQPPGFRMLATEDHALFTLYPFRTSRRAGEVVYAFLDRPTLPPPGTNNEYTSAQMSTLLSAYRGTLIYNSNGASGVQSVNYVPPTHANRYFVAFTVDDTSNLASAHFSRAEAFLLQQADFGAKKRQQILIQLFD